MAGRADFMLFVFFFTEVSRKLLRPPIVWSAGTPDALSMESIIASES